MQALSTWGWNLTTLQCEKETNNAKCCLVLLCGMLWQQVCMYWIESLLAYLVYLVHRLHLPVCFLVDFCATKLPDTFQTLFSLFWFLFFSFLKLVNAKSLPVQRDGTPPCTPPHVQMWFSLGGGVINTIDMFLALLHTRWLFADLSLICSIRHWIKRQFWLWTTRWSRQRLSFSPFGSCLHPPLHSLALAFPPLHHLAAIYSCPGFLPLLSFFPSVRMQTTTAA